MTAGECAAPWNESSFEPEDLIDPAQPQASGELRIVLQEEYYLNHRTQTCERVIAEHLSTRIRGIDLSHRRMGDWRPVPYELCLGI